MLDTRQCLGLPTLAYFYLSWIGTSYDPSSQRQPGSDLAQDATLCLSSLFKIIRASNCGFDFSKISDVKQTWIQAEKSRRHQGQFESVCQCLANSADVCVRMCFIERNLQNALRRINQLSAVFVISYTHWNGRRLRRADKSEGYTCTPRQENDEIVQQNYYEQTESLYDMTEQIVFMMIKMSLVVQLFQLER